MTKRFQVNFDENPVLQDSRALLSPCVLPARRPGAARSAKGAFRISVNFLADEGFQNVPVVPAGTTGQSAQFLDAAGRIPPRWGGNHWELPPQP